MTDPEDSPGPDPSSLEAVDKDDIPDDATALETFQITYSTDQVSDYVRVNEAEEGPILELAKPLLDPVPEPSGADELERELADALANIEFKDIEVHFTAAVAEYADATLPGETVPSSIDLSTAADLLKRIDDDNMLRVGRIHQASGDELPNWMEFRAEAERSPDVNVGEYDDDTDARQ